MRPRRIVPWLLTLGLGLATFAWVWQRLEEDGRSDGRSIEQPISVPSEPSETLVERIQASWVPGDRLRTGLLVVGVLACAFAAWRAWRIEGFSKSVLRRVALHLAIPGVSCLALGWFRERTHPRESASWTLVRLVPEQSTGPHHAVDIGNEHVDGEWLSAGVVPLIAVGAAYVGWAALLSLASLIRAPHRSPPFEPSHAPRDLAP